MKKEDQGFTLIELIVSVAVLSVMTAILFKIFIMSGRMNMKAEREAAVLNEAKRTMEELKGSSFHELEKELSEGKLIEIAGSLYWYELLSEGEGQKGYRLIRTYGRDSKDGKAPYLVYVELDSGCYNSEEKEDQGKVYSINTYQMPNIVDVGSRENLVWEPDTLSKDDALLAEELLFKVNPKEKETDSEEDDTEEDTVEETYTEEDIVKYLSLEIGDQIKETDPKEKIIIAGMTLIYTVNQGEKNHLEDFSQTDTVKQFLSSFKKQVIWDQDARKPGNRIYVFLPETVWTEYKKILVSAKNKEKFDLCIIAPQSDSEMGMKRNDIQIVGPGKGNVVLYTNLKEDPISYSKAKTRLYRLNVAIYEADYEKQEKGRPEKGRELVRLQSTKSE